MVLEYFDQEAASECQLSRSNCGLCSDINLENALEQLTMKKNDTKLELEHIESVSNIL